MSILDGNLPRMGAQQQSLMSELTPEEMRVIERDNQMRSQQQQAPRLDVPEQSLLSKFGQRLKDPATLTGLAAAFNQMTMNPSPQLQQRATGMLQQRAATSRANQTAQYLRSKGETKLAELIEANPGMASEILKRYTASQIPTAYSRKTVGSVQTDQETGEQFIIEYDPNTGQPKRIPLGVTGLTERQKANMAIEAETLSRDKQAAYEAGQDLMKQIGLVDRNISNLGRLAELSEGGAKTGYLNDMLPTFNANTAEFENIARQMGLDVIGSVTFGALSATELRLALRQGFPPGLQGQELLKYVEDKVRAQTRLRKELLKRARFLLGGNTLSDFAELTAKEDEINNFDWESAGVPAGQWQNMTFDERKAFVEAGEE